MSGHTPGPWGTYLIGSTRPVRSESESDYGRLVVLVRGLDRMAQADASLIAAAPDLLDELIEEVERLESWAERADMMAQDSIDGGWSTHQVDALRSQADEYRRRASGLRRTIAKATEAPDA